jgi:hypothetical protein
MLNYAFSPKVIGNFNGSQRAGEKSTGEHRLLREQDVLASYAFLTQRLPTPILELRQLLELLELLFFILLCRFTTSR